MHHHPLLVVAILIADGPPALLLALLIATVLAMRAVRAVWRIAARIRRPPRRGDPHHPTGADTARHAPWSAQPLRRAATHPGRPHVNWCYCGHLLAEHVGGTGRCRDQDDDGEHCACRAFEHEPEQDLDED